eukprot:764775-Hanusia_phi.AAC.1
MVQSPTSASSTQRNPTCSRGDSLLEWALVSSKSNSLPDETPSALSNALDYDLPASTSSSSQPQTLLAGIGLHTPSSRPKLGKIQTKRLLQSSLEEEG